MKKHNILIIVDTLKIGGGSDKFAAILGSELHEQGYNISYLTLMDGDPKYSFKGDYQTLDETDIYGNNFKRGLDLLRYSRRIKSICEELKIDTVISAGDPANFQAIMSRFLFGNRVRLIITQHMNPGIFLDSPLRYRLIKFFYPLADEVVCVSQAIEKILNEDYGVKNTRTIYNMMEIEKNIELSTEELPGEYKELFEGDNFNFINMGRLDRQKGQWFLIRSFRGVVDHHKNARLFILGEGDLRGELEDLIKKLDLKENIFLLGDQKNVFPFFRKSDCFIFSSLWEGLPLSLIESISLNIPVISTDCKTGPREILCPELDLDEKINYPYLGQYAVLTQPFPNQLFFKDLNEVPLSKSEKTLSELLIRMIEDSDFRKKYTNGHEIAKNFDKKEIINNWNNLLKPCKN